MAEEKKPDAAPPKPPGPPAPPPPKNPGFVTAIVDGKEVVVKPGTTVIEAAKAVGIDIPYYCYHKRLSIAANCRMCLVEMSNAPGGKLMPACQMPVAEGVTVKTDTPRVKDQQRATLEFLLLNHPVDCSICDQAGECKLQDYYMAYDRQPSRLDVPKVMKGKRVELGPTVTLDQERCILCTRCVRFMREVAENPQLGVAQRGNESFITTFPGQPLDDKYAGNVVDICPVGALTSTDFRFRGRVWFMSSARSVCTGCARGCNTFLDYLNDVTYRYRPRENDAVNEEWMCDDGRTSYKYLNAGRVLVAREGRGANAQPLPRKVAPRRAAEVLLPHVAAGSLAVLLSPVASLEDLLVACKVAKEGLKVGEVYAGGRADGWQDDFLKRADENPNRKGLELAAAAYGLAVRPFADLVAAAGAGKVKGLWAVGTEVPDAKAAEKLGALEIVAQSYGDAALAQHAAVLLPASPHSEMDGTFVNFEGRAQRFEMAYFPKGESRPHWALAAELGAALGLPLAFASGREVFAALGPQLGSALGDFAWDSLPSTGSRLGIVPLAAGTVDGRLPGNRDRVPSETTEDYRRAMSRTS
ncbi:2Fe-2S iron-sulfur cluster-binding protein [Anaeromyxobacter dehalogenans]|uniref:NADH dehydrogenase subunit G n=1 Tax=Anaeromyxobacter dehalogenans (strain 2CP-C) TaxID=290397 RepID=Q2IL07_ANADE|nr:2Fe-2S iron-sulfur cluster-binding protein [Anaeromyxobacter dehalogenans]ABC82336.1 NADH dehydrogenase subunit G [Anaeromyxobacter dehalogenans 2CP-C]